jgi:hypothetical protein
MHHEENCENRGGVCFSSYWHALAGEAHEKLSACLSILDCFFLINHRVVHAFDLKSSLQTKNGQLYF